MFRYCYLSSFFWYLFTTDLIYYLYDRVLFCIYFMKWKYTSHLRRWPVDHLLCIYISIIFFMKNSPYLNPLMNEWIQYFNTDGVCCVSRKSLVTWWWIKSQAMRYECVSFLSKCIALFHTVVNKLFALLSVLRTDVWIYAGKIEFRCFVAWWINNRLRWE